MDKTGDKHDRFMQLFLRYQPRLYAMIRAQIINRADAEDVMQDAATVLWRRFDEFEQGTHFDRWAFRILRLRVLKYFEQRRSQRLVFDLDLLDKIADEATLANSVLDDTRDALEHCLGKLPDRDRKIVRIRYQEGATNRTVAQEIGKSDSSVSRMLNRIYGLLLNCIQMQLSPQSGGDQ